MWAVPEHRLRVPLKHPQVESYLSSSAAAGAFCNEQRVASKWPFFVEHAGPEAVGLPRGTIWPGQARGSQRGRLCEERKPRSEVAERNCSR